MRQWQSPANTNHTAFCLPGNGKPVTLTATVPVWTCDTCGDQYTDGEAELIRHDAICHYLARLTPGEIRSLRATYSMSQADLADLTGIGIASIKRWETGNLIQGAAHDRLLRLLTQPQNVRTLRSLHQPSISSSTAAVFRTPVRPEAIAAASKFRIAAGKLNDTMYVTTFYSFKGGVGRSMALLNVAVELASCGRRVLVVDFDLEAPGIQTCAPFNSDRTLPGLVEYISEYIATRRAPDVAGYLHRANVPSSLSFMPSGIQDATYASRLNAIDWLDLYQNLDGYLMFEDLKQQWRNHGFDYVLVESRTGYTDVGGICTRQLPEAVVLMFFPRAEH